MVFSSILNLTVPKLIGLGAVVAGSSIARGWGESIKWTSLDEGKAMARRSSKPIMVVIHKNKCPACNDLKPKFAIDSDIQNLSRHFVMVNLETDEVPKSSEFQPDGPYVPRILFFGPDCKLISDVHNSDKAQKFRYNEVNDIADNMRQVLNDIN